MQTTAFGLPSDLLPCPVATEITDELPSEFDFVSAFAPLVAQWRAVADPLHPQSACAGLPQRQPS